MTSDSLSPATTFHLLTTCLCAFLTSVLPLPTLFLFLFLFLLPFLSLSCPLYTFPSSLSASIFYVLVPPSFCLSCAFSHVLVRLMRDRVRARSSLARAPPARLPDISGALSLLPPLSRFLPYLSLLLSLSILYSSFRYPLPLLYSLISLSLLLINPPRFPASLFILHLSLLSPLSLLFLLLVSPLRPSFLLSSWPCVFSCHLSLIQLFHSQFLLSLIFPFLAYHFFSFFLFLALFFFLFFFFFFLCHVSSRILCHVSTVAILIFLLCHHILLIFLLFFFSDLYSTPSLILTHPPFSSPLSPLKNYTFGAQSHPSFHRRHLSHSSAIGSIVSFLLTTIA